MSAAETPAPNGLLATSAAVYAEHGVAIFPIHPRGKLPALPRCPHATDRDGNNLTGPALAEHAADCDLDGHGFYDATTDPDTVRRWWADTPDANIGIACGANNILVIDVDGPEGRQALDQLQHAHQPLPDTYQVITGRAEGSGRHHIYRQPPGQLIRSSKHRLGHPKLEIKGDGGYVIGPPSIHESGRPYVAEGHWTGIADAPTWLINRLTDQPATPPAAHQPSPRDIANKRLAGLCGTVAIAVEGNRNDTLNWAAYQAGRMIGGGQIDYDTAEDALTTAAERAGLTTTETRATIASGITAGRKNPDYPDTTSDPNLIGAPQPAAPTVPAVFPQIQTGAEFILDTDHKLTPLWGDTTDVAWAQGEPLILTGPTGVGKTTIAHQLLERLIGVTDQPLLGLPVAGTAQHVLYLACDRPNQIRRAFARRFHAAHRQTLHDRLSVHNGYLPVMVDRDPTILTQLAESVGADVIVIDSLKDVATEIEKGPNAQAVNAALQLACQKGIDVLVLHHQRKAQGDNKRPRAIDDLYGNTLIPAGAGSVILLWGTPGDLAVDLHHLKIPADEIGPLKVVHNHVAGESYIDNAEQIDLMTIAARTPEGLTVPQAAHKLFGTSPSSNTRTARNEREKARRQLDRAVDRGVLTKISQGVGTATIYRAVAAPRTVPL